MEESGHTPCITGPIPGGYDLPGPNGGPSLRQLEDEIAELAAQIDAATYRLLVLIAEFDRRQGWGNGFRSCAHWLSYRIGHRLATAREKGLS
jgi:hypothetical protein